MTSRYAKLIDQEYFFVPSFALESGVILRDAPIAYKTWGKLNEERDNVMVICHAFTGSSDVEDWWGPLMGPGKVFDPKRYFIFCANTMGSPYGSASPVTTNPDTGEPYGPEFPATTIRDDVRLHKLVLDHLGVRSIAVVIGGSMGGMAVLEWPLCTPEGFVRRIIPIATSSRHSAWCISWGEAQRQSIYSDPAYEDGYYTPGKEPHSGLAAARMAALLTYRTRDSFESRFGRKPQKVRNEEIMTPPRSPSDVGNLQEACVAAHNDGHKYLKKVRPRQRSGQNGEANPSSSSSSSSSPSSSFSSPRQGQLVSVPSPRETITFNPTTPFFSAQSYLRYQGDKFTNRFDANCYIHITRKMDTHDIARGRYTFSSSFPSEEGEGEEEEGESKALAQVLSTLPARALIIGIQTDGLFMVSEQRELAEHIPQAQLVIINSPDGHDGFLLEFQQINTHILRYLKGEFPEYYEKDGEGEGKEGEIPVEDFTIKKTSVFGEAEADITRW